MASSLSMQFSAARAPMLPVYAYVIGQVSGEQMVLQEPGTWGSAETFLAGGTPLLIQNDTAFQIDLPPQDVIGGRVYLSQQPLLFSAASIGPSSQAVLQYPDPANAADVNYNSSYSFVEFAWSQASGSWINLSYVDFVGLPVGIRLEQPGSTASEAVCGLSPTSLDALCTALERQSSVDGQPWAELCVRASDQRGWHRAISPWQYQTTHPGAFNGLWHPYVDAAWSRFQQEVLLVDTESSSGRVACRVVSDRLQCDGDDRGYDRPTTADIFSCASGPFELLPEDSIIRRAVVPRLCAAFTRSTLHLPEGNIQPVQDAQRFYLPTVTHYWSKIIHSLEADGRGYAFPYDDVGGAVSGLLHASGPAVLTIMVGSC